MDYSYVQSRVSAVKIGSFKQRAHVLAIMVADS